MLIKIFQDEKTVPNADRWGALEPATLHGQFFLSFDFFCHSTNSFFENMYKDKLFFVSQQIQKTNKKRTNLTEQKG